MAASESWIFTGQRGKEPGCCLGKLLPWDLLYPMYSEDRGQDEVNMNDKFMQGLVWIPPFMKATWLLRPIPSIEASSGFWNQDASENAQRETYLS